MFVDPLAYAGIVVVTDTMTRRYEEPKDLNRKLKKANKERSHGEMVLDEPSVLETFKTINPMDLLRLSSNGSKMPEETVIEEESEEEEADE